MMEPTEMETITSILSRWPAAVFYFQKNEPACSPNWKISLKEHIRDWHILCDSRAPRKARHAECLSCRHSSIPFVSEPTF